MVDTITIPINFKVGATDVDFESATFDVIDTVISKTSRSIVKNLGINYNHWLRRVGQRIQKAARARAPRGSRTLWNSIRAFIIGGSDVGSASNNSTIASLRVEMSAQHAFFQEYGYRPHRAYGRRVSAGVIPSMTIATWLTNFRGFRGVTGGSVINIRGKPVINPFGVEGGERLSGHIMGSAFNAVWSNAVKELDEDTLVALKRGSDEGFLAGIRRRLFG